MHLNMDKIEWKCDLTLIIATVLKLRQIYYNVIIIDVFGSAHCNQRKFILQ